MIKNFVKMSVMLLVLGVLFICNSTYADGSKTNNELNSLTGSVRVVEYLDPFSLTLSNYLVQNNVLNTIVNPPKTPTIKMFVRQLVRVPNKVPSRSPCRPI
jgi:hypothetical protein